VSRRTGDHAGDSALDDSALDDSVFAALGDPTRRAILQLVVDEGPVSATALASRLPITRQGVAKHLGVLRDAGLVRAERRGRETQFEASLSQLEVVSTWVDDVGAAWDRRLDRLGRSLRPR
jgi:DNA-binding transcriptional ArsR family regulator